LGIIRPDPGSLKFIVKPAKDADAEDRQIADQVLQVQQSSLFEAPLTPLEKPEFAFLYRYTSANQPHTNQIHDWEVQAAHRQYKRRYGDEALDHLKRMYGETIPTRNLHFIMGTMAAHPRTFIVIGLLRSGLDPHLWPSEALAAYPARPRSRPGTSHTRRSRASLGFLIRAS